MITQGNVGAGGETTALVRFTGQRGSFGGMARKFVDRLWSGRVCGKGEGPAALSFTVGRSTAITAVH